MHSSEDWGRSRPLFGRHRPHPNYDITVMHCSRCGCPPDAHASRLDEQEKAEGNYVFALWRWDEAIRHYTAALAVAPASAVLFSNRLAAYAAKGWGVQAAANADRALAMQPDWA